MAMSFVTVLLLLCALSIRHGDCVKWRYTTVRVYEAESAASDRLWLRGGTMDKGEPIPIRQHRGIMHDGNTGPPDALFAQWAEGDTMLDLDGAEEGQGQGAEGTPMMQRPSGMVGMVAWEAHFEMECDQLLPDYQWAYNRFLAKAVRTVKSEPKWEMGPPHVVECGKLNSWLFVEKKPEN